MRPGNQAGAAQSTKIEEYQIFKISFEIPPFDSENLNNVRDVEIISSLFRFK